MINIQLTPNEWQTLSEYMDGQLSERDARQVEMRLQSKPEYRAGLEELRRNRAVLRSLPKRRAPRNFTLSAALAQQIRPVRRSQPRMGIALRYVSAFASILLVLTFFGDIALKATQQNLASSAANEMQPMIEMAAPEAATGGDVPDPSARSMASPAETAEPAEESELYQSLPAGKMPTPTTDPYPANAGELMFEAAPTQPVQEQPQEAGGEGDLQTQTEDAAMGAMEVEEAPTQTPSMAAAGMGGGEYDESIQGDNLLPTETPAVQARVFPTDTPSALAQGLPMDPPPSETPASEGLTILPPNQAPEPSQVKAYDQPKLDFSQLLKPAEILLAAIALLSALGAFIFFWKNRA